MKKMSRTIYLVTKRTKIQNQEIRLFDNQFGQIFYLSYRRPKKGVLSSDNIRYSYKIPSSANPKLNIMYFAKLIALETITVNAEFHGGIGIGFPRLYQALPIEDKLPECDIRFTGAVIFDFGVILIPQYLELRLLHGYEVAYYTCTDDHNGTVTSVGVFGISPMIGTIFMRVSSHFDHTRALDPGFSFDTLPIEVSFGLGRTWSMRTALHESEQE